MIAVFRYRIRTLTRLLQRVCGCRQPLCLGEERLSSSDESCDTIAATARWCAPTRRSPETAGFQRAMDSLRLAGIDTRVYTRTPPDVPAHSVLERLEENSSAPVDAVVAIGGGSCIDLAKLVAMLRSYPGSLLEYYGENAVPGPCVPVVAVPTTSGTGSEVTPVAVLSDPGRRMKVGVSSAYLIPRATICDPELTLTCPPTVSAHAGIDALVHATEAYTAAAQPGAWDDYPGWVFRGKNAFSDIHALTAIRLIHGSLERWCHTVRTSKRVPQ